MVCLQALQKPFTNSILDLIWIKSWKCFCRYTSAWFARSPDGSVGSSFTPSHKSGLTKWNKHYCVQLIQSCRISWGRMGPQRLREAIAFRFIAVGRLMKQTHQGCLGRYLKLDLIFTTIYMKTIWFVVSGPNPILKPVSVTTYPTCSIYLVQWCCIHKKKCYLPGCIVRNMMTGLFNANWALMLCCLRKYFFLMGETLETRKYLLSSQNKIQY